MTELTLQQPELIGREDELNKLKQSLDNAIEGKGSTIFIAGEAGIGKTRLVSELKKYANTKGLNIIQGWCLAESLEPLMPIKTALREAGMFHLISGDPPPKVVSAYLINDAGMLMNKAEREESSLDPEIFASMLQAVGSFVQDSLSMMDSAFGANLNSLGYGEYTILLQTSGILSLATVIKGMNSEFLIDDMKEVLEGIGDEFNDWSGDIDETKVIQPKISWFINSGKYDGRFLVDDAKIRQENLFDNILLGIQRASSDKPLLLFLDDLQWSDPSSLALLHYLARNTRDSRVLILGTYRPEDIVEAHDGKAHHLETTTQNMNREDLVDKIELKRLGPEDTSMIINSALGKTTFDDEFLNMIYKETGGTPFFILEIVKLLMEDASIAINDEDGSWKLIIELDKLDVPSKVYDVVKRRLDRLMKEQKEVLECASVIGGEFSPDVLEKATETRRLTLLKNLGEIEKTHHLIHFLKNKYQFDHSKIQEVLYNGISEVLRKEYHRIVADTISEIYKDNMDDAVSDLAYHYFKAGDERAGECLVKAGDMAKEEYANEEAIWFYDNAAKLSDNEANSEILEKLADIQALIGEYDTAIENYERAKELARDIKPKARNLRKIGVVYEEKGEYDKSLEMQAKAKEVVEEGTVEYGRILLGEGYPYNLKGDYDKAMALFLEALDIFKKASADKKDIGNSLRAIGNLHRTKGDYDNALDYNEESLSVMEGIGDQLGIAKSLVNIGLVHWNGGELALALEFYGRGLEIFEKMGNKSGIAKSLINIGLVHHDGADLALALEFYGRSLEIFEKIGEKFAIASSLNNIGIVHWEGGELALALEFYGRSLEIRENIGDKRGIAMSLNNIGIMHLEKGDLALALEFFERGSRICMEIGVKQLSVHHNFGLAEAYLGLGKVQNALEDAEKGLEIAVEIGAKEEEAIGHRVLGKVYGERKDWDKAVEEFEKAREILEVVGRKDELSKTIFEQAIFFKAKGEPDKAIEYLEQSLSEFQRMGMKLWVEKCEKAIADLN